MKNYEDFLKSKTITDKKSGFAVKLEELNKQLFDFQKIVVRWAIARGRAAIFADCGLGKTPMQLCWADKIYNKTKQPILILAPLAVSEQTKQEGVKFGYEVNICRSQSDIVDGINITNYEILHKFNPDKFSAIVLDESSILKNFSGMRRNEIIDFSKTIQYKLACTATPSPNDYMELGNHSEFLNIMTRTEMLAMFFINDTKDTGEWRLKGHVRNNIFWQWLSSWSVMFTKPSDLGFKDDNFILPDINYFEHIIETNEKPKRGFFVKEAITLNDRRKVRNKTIDLRCGSAASLINNTDDRWVVWCGLNSEGDYIEKQVNDIVQVAGRHDNEIKSKRMLGFADGEIKRIVTKPKIAGLGMNWQICSKAAFVGLSDSWEQFYQAIRRIWRFGQKNKVEIHIFLEEREGRVLENIKRKDKQSKEMIANMVKYMSDLMKKELNQSSKEFTDYKPSIDMELPEWL